MAKALHKLTDKQVRNSKEGRFSDGGGLFLVAGASARRWVFRYRLKRARGEGAAPLREMPLGRFGDGVDCLSLAEARLAAAEKRKVVADGGDPAAAPVLPTEQRMPTFGEMADELIEAKVSANAAKGGVKGYSDKSLSRIRYALNHHAAALRPLPVDLVGQDEVVGVLQPIWRKTPIMAEKVRGYIWQVMDNAGDHYSGRNPAEWTDRLKRRLGARERLVKGHHPALPFERIAAFLDALRALEDEPHALALEFLILTAARSGEVRQARWEDFDIPGAVWTIPLPKQSKGEGKAERRPHRVPLSAPAVAILRQLAAKGGARPAAFVFGAGLAAEGGMNAFTTLIKGLQGDGEPRWIDPEQGKRPISPHGFRSTFREWVEPVGGYSYELGEQALGHSVGNKTARSYRRSDALEARRPMMDAWATYCEGKPSGSTVIPFPRQAENQAEKVA